MKNNKNIKIEIIDDEEDDYDKFDQNINKEKYIPVYWICRHCGINNKHTLFKNEIICIDCYNLINIQYKCLKIKH